MRRVVGLMLAAIAIVVGVSSVRSNKIDTIVKANVAQLSPTLTSSLGKGKAYECWKGLSLVFKEDEEIYHTYIFNPEEHRLDMDVWETEIGKVGWSPGCVKVAFTRGTPSAGYYVSVLDAQKLTEVSIDLYKEFIDETEHGSNIYTYGHMYTYFEEWQTDDSIKVSVSGHRDGEVEQPPAIKFSVDANTGKVIKRIL